MQRINPNTLGEPPDLVCQTGSATQKRVEQIMKDFEIRCNESHLEDNHTLYGRFTLGPFLPGQGTTFGNALRRSLLSELSGLGITAFEIIGVMQEFSTLPGLRESVLELSLNLKQVVLTGLLPHSTPPIGFLKVRGPAIIRAADLILPPGICCAYGEQHIATLASDGLLSFKFLVSVGKGHSVQPTSLYRSLSKVKLQCTTAMNALDSGLMFDSVKESAMHPKAKDAKKLHRVHFEESDDTSKNQGSESTNKDVSSMGVNQPGINQQNLLSLHDKPSEFQVLSMRNIERQTFQRVKPHQVLPIDAVFTPVRKVNFLTEVNDRLETARENVVLEIWTNGSIHPKRALEEAALSLVQNFDGLLKNIQRASSFQKGTRYWNHLQGSKDKKKRNNLSEIQGAIIEDAKRDARKVQTTNLSTRSQNSILQKTKEQNEESIQEKNVSTLDSDYAIQDKPSFHDASKMQRAVYNLDIGNLDISLQTYISLKRAKINILADLLNRLSSEADAGIREESRSVISSKVTNTFADETPKKADIENHLVLDEKIINELKKVFDQLGIQFSSYPFSQ